jgi:hypothetical protein
MRAAALLALVVALGSHSAAARPLDRTVGHKYAKRSLPSRFGGVNLAVSINATAMISTNE